MIGSYHSGSSMVRHSICGLPSFYELHTSLSPTLARDLNSDYLLCNGERRGSSSQEAQGITRVLYFLASDSSME